jgi:transposase-like protein
MCNPFRFFYSSPEVIRLVVMMYIRYPLSLRQIENLLFERAVKVVAGARNRLDLQLQELLATIVPT